LNRYEVELWNGVLSDLARQQGGVTLLTVDGALVETGGRACVYEVSGKASDETPVGLTIGLPAGLGRPLSPGRRVSLLVARESRRVVGSCEVTERVTVPLNGGKVARALRLSRPMDVSSAQRRDRYRAEVSGVMAEPVWMTPIGPSTGEGRDAGGLLLEGRLIDIGGGGLRVRLQGTEKEVRSWIEWARYAVRIDLPDEGDGLGIEATVRHVEKVEPGVRDLGMQFEGDETRLAELDRRLMRFVAWVQRERLARRRDAA